MQTLKEELMERDGNSEQEALERIKECKQDFYERLANGEDVWDICSDHFDLEPDFLEDLMF